MAKKPIDPKFSIPSYGTEVALCREFLDTLFFDPELGRGSVGMMADSCGIHRNTIYNWLGGRQGIPGEWRMIMVMALNLWRANIDPWLLMRFELADNPEYQRKFAAFAQAWADQQRTEPELTVGKRRKKSRV